MEKDDGGSAFPHQHNMEVIAQDGMLKTYGNNGMSLRDWFAGMALQGYMAGEACVRNLECGWTSKEVSEQSYALADAMLAERKK